VIAQDRLRNVYCSVNAGPSKKQSHHPHYACTYAGAPTSPLPSICWPPSTEGGLAAQPGHQFRGSCPVSSTVRMAQQHAYGPHTHTAIQTSSLPTLQAGASGCSSDAFAVMERKVAATLAAWSACHTSDDQPLSTLALSGVGFKFMAAQGYCLAPEEAA
jgi:hypothetical protein